MTVSLADKFIKDFRIVKGYWRADGNVRIPRNYSSSAAAKLASSSSAGTPHWSFAHRRL